MHSTSPFCVENCIFQYPSHCLILIFTYLLVLSSSATSTRSSLSMYSMPLTILYTVIRSPPISFTHSSYFSNLLYPF
ncbi:hypothetical protein E2C01_040157 [Portunus trituberculatus]|uniref:Uncharacterized protein n=1 Tax=Portunus trituberculatus TaxID=210409 RepID=A0A5B7FM82_PORTR|nr:hypothetical protein [Portunus trituberculatus]